MLKNKNAQTNVYRQLRISLEVQICDSPCRPPPSQALNNTRNYNHPRSYNKRKVYSVKERKHCQLNNTLHKYMNKKQFINTQKYA